MGIPLGFVFRVAEIPAYACPMAACSLTSQARTRPNTLREQRLLLPVDSQDPSDPHVSAPSSLLFRPWSIHESMAARADLVVGLSGQFAGVCRRADILTYGQYGAHSATFAGSRQSRSTSSDADIDLLGVRSTSTPSVS